MKNAWVNHVKQYASGKGLKYKDALKDPECSASYKSGSGLLGMTQEGIPKPVKPRVLNMTRYGPAGTFTREDARRIDEEYKEMRNKPTVNSVTY